MIFFFWPKLNAFVEPLFLSNVRLCIYSDFPVKVQFHTLGWYHKNIIRERSCKILAMDLNQIIL